jgi:hypothetical protein
MSSTNGKDKNHRPALRAFAESEAISNSEDENGLDIIGSSRRSLDLSQYIEGQFTYLSNSQTLYVDATVVLTQSQTQFQENHGKMKTRDAVELISDDELENAPRSKAQRSPATSSGTDEVADEEDDIMESDWSEEDTRAVYQEWKDRKKNKRKRR